jgi:glutathione S-transferase
MPLRLFYSSASPFVRKVRVAAYEKGVEDQIELLQANAWPVRRDAAIVRNNPTGRVPTALLDDGSALFDSRVIVSFVDTMANGQSLYPQSQRERFRCLTLEALADGGLEAALLCRYEAVLRPKEYFWKLWHDSQWEKVESSIDDLEARWIDVLEAPANAGNIAAACFLGYLDFRFPDKFWRTGRPRVTRWFETFSARSSMQQTMPE